MKTAILYYSRHHENTKKLLDAIAAEHPFTAIDVTKTEHVDLTGYDLIGFASGINYSRFHKRLEQLAEQALPAGKRVFFLYTYGVKKEGYTKSMEAIAARKSAEVVGSFGCLGWNTFGPFKLIGGIAKGHPDQGELEGARRFYAQMVEREQGRG